MRGRFITFEGGEGSGKSTQLSRLAARLTAQGLAVVATREPGGCPAAEEIRQLLVTGETGRWDPLSEALLHYTARRAHLLETVIPALARGQWVLSDRFSDSTLAYQGYGHRLGQAAIEHVAAAALGDQPSGTTRPDLTLILDLPVAVGLARAGARPGTETRYERLAIDFHERVRQGFQEIAAAEPERCVVIDAEGDADTVERMVEDVVAARFEAPRS
jgi:dTMP kinase